MDNKNSRIICNKCNIADASPVIHCSVCCCAFHYKCVFCDVPETIFEHLVNLNGFQWYCPSDRDFTTSKLLDRLSLMERKLMEKPSSFDDVFNDVVLGAASTAQAANPTSEREKRKQVRSRKRAIGSPSEAQEVIPAKKGKQSSAVSDPGVQLTAAKQPVNKKTVSFPTLQSHDNNDDVVASLPNDQAVLRVDPPVQHNTIKEVVATPQDNATSNDSSQHSKLVVVPRIKRRTIYISRLGPETSSDEVKLHIKENFPASKEVRITKFEGEIFTKYSSFIISCEEEDFKGLLNRSQWPSGMDVREFFPKAGRNRRGK